MTQGVITEDEKSTYFCPRCIWSVPSVSLTCIS